LYFTSKVTSIGGGKRGNNGRSDFKNERPVYLVGFEVMLTQMWWDETKQSQLRAMTAQYQ